jgi:membrane-bound serine protease (ClpP class)
MKAFSTGFWAALGLLAFSFFLPGVPALASPTVYVIDVHGPVAPWQATFVENKLDEAARNGASAVILDVDTFGGLAQSAVDMKNAIMSHDRDFVTVGYVHDTAFSSGSLITLSCKNIAMTPEASLGSAQIHAADGGDPGPEAVSAFRSIFMSTAEARGRNPKIASAWLTSTEAIPSLGVKVGDILTLTTKEAQANGYCDVVASSYPDILSYLKLPGAVIVQNHLDALQATALFIAMPAVTILLLVIGTILVIWEMMTFHSWGIAGAIGGVVVGGVFISHIIAGTAGWIGLVLFIVGVALVLLETHLIPTHGLLMLGGTVCAAVGLFYALGGTQQNASFAASTSVILVAIALISFLFYLPKFRIWKIIGLPNKQQASAGYVSSADYREFLGARGKTLSLLRPSGIADFSGTRLDVMTEGEYVAPNTNVEIFHIEGSKIVVRPVDTSSNL